MAPTPRQFGMRLKAIRTKKKLSQAAVATRAGLSREYVNKIERGRYDPPLSTITALAKALKVRPGSLLD